MRFLKRVSFFLYSCLVFGAGFYVHMKYEDFFYPQAGGAGWRSETPMFTQEAVAVSATSLTTTCDTRVTWKIREGDREYELQENLSEKYIGLDRASFVRVLEADAKAPPLSERRKGFVSVEVERFSPESIVIQKTYRPFSDALAFTLKVVDNRVIVYRDDSGEIYLETRIDVRNLPDELRTDILMGNIQLDKTGLDSFLETFARS